MIAALLLSVPYATAMGCGVLEYTVEAAVLPATKAAAAVPAATAGAALVLAGELLRKAAMVRPLAGCDGEGQMHYVVCIPPALAPSMTSWGSGVVARHTIHVSVWLPAYLTTQCLDQGVGHDKHTYTADTHTGDTQTRHTDTDCTHCAALSPPTCAAADRSQRVYT